MRGLDRSVSAEAVPIFGRFDVRERIERAFGRVRGGGGRGLLLVGGSGVGKSALLSWSMDRAHAQGFDVLVGRSLPEEIPPPFSLVHRLLSSREGGRYREEEAAGIPPVLPMLFAPEIFPYAEGQPATDVEEPSADAEEARWLIARLGNPLDSVDFSRSALRGRLIDFFLHHARRRPLLLALDDLHFADAPSIEFLSELLPRLPEVPLVVVVTIAPETEMPPGKPGALSSITQAPGIERILLRPLGEEDFSEYVRWLLHGREANRDAIMRWFTQTEGNPLFVEHLVRASMGGKGTAERDTDLTEILLSRIRLLPDDQRRVIVYGSVLGKEFDFPSLAALSEENEERLSENVNHLVQAGLLRERPGEVYEFVSEPVRVEVYAELTETRRRILHAKASKALETLGETDVFELARQYYLGRNDEKAVEFNRRAADRAAQSFAYETAVVHLERAIECERRLSKRDKIRELRLQIELGRFLDDLGYLRRSKEILQDTVAQCRIAGVGDIELALALLGLAQTTTDLSDYEQSCALAKEAFQLLEIRGTPRQLMAAHRVLGTALWRLSDLPAAEAHHRAALELAEREGTPLERGHVMVDLANTMIGQGESKINDALQLYEQAAGLFAAGGDGSARARVLMNRSLLQYNAGWIPEALRDMTEALEAAEESHSMLWIGYCNLNLAQLQTELGDFPAARTAIDRAVTILTPLGDRFAEQQILLIQGMLAQEEGELESAEKLLRQALERARDLKMGAEVSEVHFRLASLALRQRDRDGARRELDAAMAMGILTLKAQLTPRVADLDRRIEAETV